MRQKRIPKRDLQRECQIICAGKFAHHCYATVNLQAATRLFLKAPGK